MKFIETVIGIVLVYALLSLLVSLIAEWWSARKKTRGELLKKAIFQMLQDKTNNQNYGHLLLNHPLVSSMENKTEGRPAQYIASGIFADALIDVISSLPKSAVPLHQKNKPQQENPSKTISEQFKDGVATLGDSDFKDMIESMLIKSEGSYKKLKKCIEEWFNSNMDRASGWYKRKQKKTLFWASVLVALALNVDSIHIFRVISMDDALRDRLVSTAENIAEQTEKDKNQMEGIENQLHLMNVSIAKVKDKDNTDTLVQAFNKLENRLEQVQNQFLLSDTLASEKIENINTILDGASQLGLPIGWIEGTAPRSWLCYESDGSTADIPQNEMGRYLYHRNYKSGFSPLFWGILWWIIGILITALMLSQGASFWFDMLIKLVNVRKAGVKPLDKSKAP